jgi:hypothetical protein
MTAPPRRGGGPALAIAAILRDREGYPVTTRLTDLHPDLSRFDYLSPEQLD